MISWINVQRPRLVTLPRVVHDDRSEKVRLYYYEYNDGLDPKHGGARGITNKYNYRSRDDEYRQKSKDDYHNQLSNTSLQTKITTTGCTIKVDYFSVASQLQNQK